jgi:predicted permease
MTRGIQKIRLRLRSLFQAQQVEQELDEELQFHLDRQIDAFIARGMTPREARDAALREMRGLDRQKEECRDARGLALLEGIGQDVRYALRMARKSPGFSTVVILSLALGIGANTAIFSLLNVLMLRTLPVREPGQLVELLTNVPSEPRIMAMLNGFPEKIYEHYRDHNDIFADLIGIAPAPGRLHLRLHGPGNESEAVNGEYVTGNLFQALGVQPAIGRLIGPQDDRLGSPDAASAVISWSFWKNRFNLDPAIAGTRIVIDDVPAVIVGVAPQTFFGLQVGAKPDVWLPAAMEPMIDHPSRLFGSEALTLKLMGRLKPGVSIDQARAQMRVLDQFRVSTYAARLPGATWLNKLTIDVVPASTGLSAARVWYGRPLLGLMAIVALLLLIACTNVASLLLARGVARQKELAVRLSLGAGRLRLARQLVTESLVLSLLGCVPGILLAYVGATALVAMVASGRQPQGVPLRLGLNFQIDWAVLLFNAGVAVLSGALFGLVSAWNAFASAPVSAMREAGHTSETPSRRLFGKMLVVSQVAVSIVLLSAAGLFVAHLSTLRNVGLGFERDSVLLVSLDRSRSGYQPAQLAALNRELLDRLGALPGVRSATLSGVTPIQGPGAARKITVDGFVERPEDRRYIDLNWVAPKFFDTFGTPLIAGRDFTFDDVGRQSVAILSQALARHYFGKENPVGRHLTLDTEGGPYEVIGVVADAKYSDLHDAAAETIYLHAFQERPERFAQFSLRTNASPAAVAGAVRYAVRDVMKTVSIGRLTTLTEQMDASIVPERLIATLSSLFGLLGAALAAIGVYGLLAFTVTRRVTEIGIRMALGATGAEVMRMVLKGALGLVCAGLAVGVPLAILTRHATANMIFHPPAERLLPIVAAAAAMIVLALLAAFLPARRAARVQPMDALRQ